MLEYPNLQLYHVIMSGLNFVFMFAKKGLIKKFWGKMLWAIIKKN